MIFKLKTSKKTMEIFDSIGASTNLRPFALSKIAIALSLKQDYETLNFSTDNYGLELNKQTITANYDPMYKCLIEIHCKKHLNDEEYFPKHVKAHIDRGALLLQNEFRYANDFLIHLSSLEDSI